MNDSQSEHPPHMNAYFRNWISFGGLIITVGGLFAFIFLVAMDFSSGEKNPYVGILTYIVAPAFMITGLTMALWGAWIRRKQILRFGTGSRPGGLAIDLNRPRDRQILAVFGTGGVVFLLMTAFGSYQTYHFTESVNFCGQTCHVVMEPEFVTYKRGEHARVACAECHIGDGASWWVKSKLSGAYQVYSTIFKKYQTPIPTPVHNLRPAQDTCERCHWPQKFTGNIDRSYEHFLSDRNNTPFTVRMLLHVGGGHKGGDGKFSGIHWHMDANNKVEYYTTDEKRQEIPWIRVTGPDGKSTVFRNPEFKEEPPASKIRTMDCLDCHNRPAHVMQTANEGVEEAMALGKISTKLPNIKRTAVQALNKKYATIDEAKAGIAAVLREKYESAPEVPKVAEALFDIYRNNYFPLMKADYRAYPNNVGHKDWPGCFRCHDDKHVAADGKTKIKGSDCNACHVILAQGRGEDLLKLAPAGISFKHPSGELDGDLLCSDCHNGGIQGK